MQATRNKRRLHYCDCRMCVYMNWKYSCLFLLILTLVFSTLPKKTTVLLLSFHINTEEVVWSQKIAFNSKAKLFSNCEKYEPLG